MWESLSYAHFFSFGCFTTSGIAWSFGRFICSFLRNLHTVLRHGCTNLHSQQQCIRVSFPSHPHQYLLFFIFLIIAILIRVNNTSFVVFIYISLMTSETEYVFMCLLATGMSSEKYLFGSFIHFLTELFVLLNFFSFLYIPDFNPLSEASFVNIFSHSFGYLFTIVIASSLYRNFLIR